MMQRKPKMLAAIALANKMARQIWAMLARLRDPFSLRALEDQRQTKLLQTAWEKSGEAYGYPKLHDGLCDIGEDISPNRAWRLARLAGIRVQIGYKKKPGSYGGCAAVVADNTLNREFDVPSR
jgi:hypothetical protein